MDLVLKQMLELFLMMAVGYAANKFKIMTLQSE